MTKHIAYLEMIKLAICELDLPRLLTFAFANISSAKISGATNPIAGALFTLRIISDVPARSCSRIPARTKSSSRIRSHAVSSRCLQALSWTEPLNSKARTVCRIDAIEKRRRNKIGHTSVSKPKRVLITELMSFLSLVFITVFNGSTKEKQFIR